MNKPPPFAERLIAARARCGLSQAELAARLGTGSAETISRYERGIREPRYETVLRIAAALNVEPATLVGRERESAPAAAGPMVAESPRVLVGRAHEALNRLLERNPAVAALAAVSVLAIAGRSTDR